MADAIDSSTILVSVMLVNNETGAIFPVEAAARAIRRNKAPALLHVDAVQGFGKLPFTVKKLGWICSPSAATRSTPQGHRRAVCEKRYPDLAPCVWGRPGARPAFRHGKHPPDLRLGGAVRLLPPAGEALEQVGALNRLLRQKLGRSRRWLIHSPEDALPYVLNFSAGRVRGETMLHFLAQREVYVSSGSACGRPSPAMCWRPWACPQTR